jgi:hypothetical protein
MFGTAVGPGGAARELRLQAGDIQGNRRAVGEKQHRGGEAFRPVRSISRAHNAQTVKEIARNDAGESQWCIPRRRRWFTR